jgi:phosphosulfolactate phosphohydrolase-like enzyme
VCAGLLVARLAAGAPGATLSDGAAAALALGRHYEAGLDRIGRDSQWALKLRRIGREADLALCLRADVSTVVPVFSAGGFASAREGAVGLAATGRAGAHPGAGA